MRKKTLQRFASFSRRADAADLDQRHAPPPSGLISIWAGAFRTRCHKIEDVTKPAPDIATLFDACKGVMPIRDEGRRQTLPPAVRNIKLSGAPVYLHPLEVALKRLDAMSTPGGLNNFYMQNMGDPLAGQERSFNRDWVRWYEAACEDWAAGANLYIVVDPSKGVGDPTFARVEACKADKTISWVGGFRKKLPPSEFAPAIYNLAMAWIGIGNLVEIRTEWLARPLDPHAAHLLRHPSQHRRSFITCSRQYEQPRVRGRSARRALSRFTATATRLSDRASGKWTRRVTATTSASTTSTMSRTLPAADDRRRPGRGLSPDRHQGETEDGRDLDLALFPTEEGGDRASPESRQPLRWWLVRGREHLDERWLTPPPSHSASTKTTNREDMLRQHRQLGTQYWKPGGGVHHSAEVRQLRPVGRRRQAAHGRHRRTGDEQSGSAALTTSHDQ